MFGIQNFYLFLISCILLNLTPGQDTLYIVGRSVAQGKKAGIWSVFGIMSGILIHTVLAAFGLSLVLATSALAFSLVKYAGAVYLLWIGIGFFRNGNSRLIAEKMDTNRPRSWKIYRQGVFTNLLNPKVALFFLSFLPQFVDHQAGFVFIPFILLGLTLFTTGSLWCLVLVYGSSWLTERFHERAAAGTVLKKMTGTLFIGLGIKLAFSHAE